eukprot:1527448-Amphidinium_carterae.1
MNTRKSGADAPKRFILINSQAVAVIDASARSDSVHEGYIKDGMDNGQVAKTCLDLLLSLSYALWKVPSANEWLSSPPRVGHASDAFDAHVRPQRGDARG